MFYYDGDLRQEDQIKLDINDPALLYGTTIFTTLRIYDYSLAHPLTNWQAHCYRLLSTIKQFNWQLPNWENITTGAKLLLTKFPVLRITLFPDGRELIIGRNLPPQLQSKQQYGIRAQVITNPQLQRAIASYKTGNYLAPYLARQEAQHRGAQEAILIDERSNWLETSTGNLWGYHQGIWFTPLFNGNLLPGIARNLICQQANFPIQENIWTTEFVESLEAIAYSNSVVEIIPFHTIQWLDKEIKLKPNHSAYRCFQLIYPHLFPEQTLLSETD
jgi:4-amino-4-deoxychorismate lyase